jgi:hypothetical protein
MVEGFGVQEKNNINYASFHVQPHLYRNVTILLLCHKHELFMKVNILNIKNYLNQIIYLWSIMLAIT